MDESTSNLGLQFVWTVPTTSRSGCPSIWEKGGKGCATIVANEDGSKKIPIFRTCEQCNRKNGKHAQFLLSVGDIVFQASSKTRWKARRVEYFAKCLVYKVIDVYVDENGQGKAKVKLVNVLENGKWKVPFDERLRPVLEATWEKCEDPCCLTPNYCEELELKKVV